MYFRAKKPITIVEEIFNSILHGIGAILTISSMVYAGLVYTHGKQLVQVVGLFFFLATLCVMYLISTLYHSLIFTKARTVFLILDYSAIFLFIAGTYTAFITAVMPTLLGLVFLIAIWIVVITGITLRALFFRKEFSLFVAVYLLLGWFAVLIIKIVWGKLGTTTIVLLVAGGLCYTAGTIFFSLKKLPFTHTIWHIFVMAGSACHFLALLAM